MATFIQASCPEAFEPARRAADGPLVGRELVRIEDDALLVGRGRFVDDLALGCLHLVFARSPIARGIIRSLNVQSARDAAGVVAIITAADVANLGPLPVNQQMLSALTPLRPLLAGTDVAYVGEPIAAVIATSNDAARDAVERIELELDEAFYPAADSSQNQELFIKRWSSGNVESAFENADKVVQVEIRQSRVAAQPLEARATLASWDGEKGELEVWTSSQTPHRVRTDLADLLTLDPASVRVRSWDVGGAFGSKASIYPEDVVVAWAARAVGRAIKWIATRGEDLLSATHGRGALLNGELAIAADGTLLGLRAAFTFPLGAWLPYSALVPAWNAGRILPGPYSIRDVAIEVRGLRDQTAPVGIYRGAGRPEAAMLMEQLIEKASRAIKMEPAEVRRRNLLAPGAFPHSTPTGQTFDSGDYPHLLQRALELAEYPALCKQRTQRRTVGELFGVGIAFYVEPCGQGFETAKVRLEADGRAVVATGTAAQGQGQVTAFTQIAADALELPLDKVTVQQGDTVDLASGVGALASRSTAIGGSAIVTACREARAKAERGAPLPLEVSVTYTASGEAWSAGCCVVAVSLDAETGEVRVERFAMADDAGRVVNPLLVRGQLQGAFAQGVGQALMERVVYDQNGQLLTGSLMDYALPRAADVPDVLLAKLETCSPVNVLGAKGVGEAGAIGTPSALLNAVLDAASVRGVTRIDIPITAEAVWRALHQGDGQ